MSCTSPTDGQIDEQYDLESDVMIGQQTPPMCAIIMHNDDYTTMEFVVWVLVSVLELPIHVAYERMLMIHEQGRASVAILPKAVAYAKAKQIEQLAEQEEFPLLITLQSVD